MNILQSGFFQSHFFQSHWVSDNKHWLVKTAVIAIAFVIVYVLALVLTVPDRLVEQQLNKVLSQHAHWESLQKNGSGWRLVGVSTKAYPNIYFDTVDVQPRFFDLILGKAGANVRAEFQGIELRGKAAKSLSGIYLNLDGLSDKLVGLSLAPWPELGAIDSGAMRSQAEFQLGTDGNILAGKWQLNWSDIEFQGLNTKQLSLSANWNGEHFELEGRTQGDVSLKLSGQLKAAISPKPSARLNADVNIVANPEMPLLTELMGGQRLNLNLVGPLSKIKATCVDTKTCPDWVKLI